MTNLIRYFRQNRKKIWIIVVIIIFCLALLQFLNILAKTRKEERLHQAEIQSTSKASNENNQTNEVARTLNKQSTTQDYRIHAIEQFITLCNQKELESAYNMLTDDCKKEMFIDLKTFERIYYNSTFENKNKESEIEKWEDNTFLVKFTENALATGKVAKTKEEQRIDYITTVRDGDNYKLNINSFIGYRDISKTKMEDNVTIEVLGKHTYMNYETYTIRITNKTEKDVILDNLDDSNGIYIEDTNGVKYPMHNSELSNNMITIASGHIKELDIKFFSNYVSNKKIKQLVFSNIIKNNSKAFFYISL